MKRGLEGKTETDRDRKATAKHTYRYQLLCSPQRPRQGRVHMLATLWLACFKLLGLCGPLPQVGLLVTRQSEDRLSMTPSCYDDSLAGHWGWDWALLHLHKAGPAPPTRCRLGLQVQDVSRRCSNPVSDKRKCENCGENSRSQFFLPSLFKIFTKIPWLKKIPSNCKQGKYSLG